MGAPQARLSDLARRLKKSGHEVWVLTAFPNYPSGKIFSAYSGFYKQEYIDGIKIMRSWVLPSASPGFIRRLICYFTFCFSSLLAGILKKGSFDIIITESPPIFLAISGWLIAKAKKAKWVMNISDLWPQSAKYVGMFDEKSLAYRLLDELARFLYKKAWLITGQSSGIIEEIKRIAENTNTFHLTNGVDPDNFSPGKASKKIRQKYLKPGETGFVYAGLHGIFQGLDQIVYAAKDLKEYPVRFIFMGDGPVKKKLMNQAENMALSNIDFYPPLPHKNMPSLLASMDAAIITLKSPIKGAVPSKIYEAMGAGIPVLLVASGEPAKIIRNTKSGLVAAPGDIKDIVKKIIRLSEDEKLRRDLGDNGRKAALTKFNRDMIAKEFEKVLKYENFKG